MATKDPAFLFYPGDYLRDTQCLSETVQVSYDRIMCEHMRNICITQQQLNFFTKRLTDDQKSELSMVLEKVDGGFCIPWVVDSILKRREYSESRRKNREGKPKKPPLKTKDISETYDSHMESEDENVNEVNNEKENKIKEASLIILKDFNFTETKNFNKLSQISTFIRLLFSTGRFDYFREQYPAYWKYKKISGSEKQSLDTFLNDGWDREVWTEKLKQHGESKQSTASAKQQSVSDIRQAARAIIANHQSENGS